MRRTLFICISFVLFISVNFAYSYDDEDVKHFLKNSECNECDLSNYNFENSYLDQAIINNSNLTNTNFNNAKMANSQIKNSDFTNSTFIKTDMPTTKIENSIFVFFN